MLASECDVALGLYCKCECVDELQVLFNMPIFGHFLFVAIRCSDLGEELVPLLEGTNLKYVILCVSM